MRGRRLREESGTLPNPSKPAAFPFPQPWSRPAGRLPVKLSPYDSTESRTTGSKLPVFRLAAFKTT